LDLVALNNEQMNSNISY